MARPSETKAAKAIASVFMEFLLVVRQTTDDRVGRSPPPATRLAVSSLCVVSDVGSRSAPCVMAALARVVHNRQGAADPEHNGHENNQQGGLHGDLANAAPPTYPVLKLSWLK